MSTGPYRSPGRELEVEPRPPRAPMSVWKDALLLSVAFAFLGCFGVTAVVLESVRRDDVAEAARIRTGPCQDLIHYYTVNEHDFQCPNLKHKLDHKGAHVECRCVP